MLFNDDDCAVCQIDREMHTTALSTEEDSKQKDGCGIDRGIGSIGEDGTQVGLSVTNILKTPKMPVR